MKNEYGFMFEIGQKVRHIYDDVYCYIVLEQILTITNKGIERDYLVRFLPPGDAVPDNTIQLSEFELRR